MRVYYDTEAAAVKLNLSPKTLRMQVAKGVLPSYKVSPHRMVFAEDDLIAYEERHKGRFGVRSPNHPLHVAGREPLDAAREWADTFIEDKAIPFDQEAFEILCVRITPFMLSPVRTTPPEDFPRLFQIAVILEKEGRAKPVVSEEARVASTGVFAAADQFLTWQTLEKLDGNTSRLNVS